MADALCISGFQPLSSSELLFLDGGRLTAWGCIGAGAAIVAGAAGVIGGTAACLVPEPTTLTKIGGAAAIVGGWASITGGVAYFMNS